MILDAVAEKLKNLGQKTRRWVVLNDVLQNNDYQEVSDKRERIVKVLFNDYKTLSGSMRQQLLELGFEVTEEASTTGSPTMVTVVTKLRLPRPEVTGVKERISHQ